MISTNVKWEIINPIFEHLSLIDAYQSGWTGHMVFGHNLVYNLQPKIIVELGTHYGHSFFSFAKGAQDAGINPEMHAIDTWEGDEQAGFYGLSVFNTVKQIRKQYFKDNKITLHKSYFDDVQNEFKRETIHLLHIDGLHTYDVVKHDYTSWFDKVSKEGIILLHDTNQKKEGFGVYKLWKEIQKKQLTFEFEHSNGLGIVFKDKQMYEMLQPKFEDWNRLYKLYWSETRTKLSNKQYCISDVLDREIEENGVSSNRIITLENEISIIKKNNLHLINQRNSFKQKLNLSEQELKNLKVELNNAYDELNEFRGFKQGYIWKYLNKYRKLKSKL